MPGEIAIVERAVGLADRADLDVLEVTGPPGRVAESVERTTGRVPEPGATWLGSGVWWYASDAGRVLAIADSRGASRVRHAFAQPSPGLRMGADVAVLATHKVLSLIGPRSTRLLRAGGMIETPETGRGAEAVLGGLEVLVLREEESMYLIVTPLERAVELWRHLRETGRPLGVGLVGAEALARIGVSDRMRIRRHD